MAANSGKQNFLINSVGDTTTISILGDIGETWFGDGYSMQDAKRELQAIKTPKINLVVSSLGGLVNDALVIHDLIKMKDAEVTSQILGLTASSGTIVAQAADKGNVAMSKNSQHLIHNVSDIAFGNAESFKKAAAEMEKIDTTLVGIYTDRIGDKKTEQEIRDLMGKEEWVNASKAEEWGFVDEVFTPGAESATIDCYDCTAVNAHKGFPNIDEPAKPSEPAKPAEPNKNILNMFNDKFKQLTALVNSKLGNTDAPEPPAPANNDTEIQNMVVALQTDMQALTTANQALTNQLADKTTDYDKIFADYKKLAVTHAHKTEIEEIDAEIDAKADAANTNEKSYEANAEVLREG